MKDQRKAWVEFTPEEWKSHKIGRGPGKRRCAVQIYANEKRGER